MKYIALAVWIGLTTLPAAARAGQLSDFVKASVDAAEADSAFNLAGQKLGAAYVPLRALDKPFANIADAGVGAVLGAGSPQGLVSARINLPQLINGIFGLKWFVSATHGPTLPTLFFGPAVKAAWPPNSWTWRKDAYLLIGIPLGGLGI